jgi:hypothetical protein
MNINPKKILLLSLNYRCKNMNPKKPSNFALNSVLLLIVGITGLLWFPSCKDEPFEYKIDRANAFSFRLDTFDVVITDDVVFFVGPSVLHVFNDTTQVLYERISLQAHGITPSSKEYWFVVDFDTHMDGNAVGTYQSQYDIENGGINDMRLIVDNAGELLEYKAVPDINAVYFQVDAQREEERIMKGVFGGVLYLNGDVSKQPSFISDGIFKDIKY